MKTIIYLKKHWADFFLEKQTFANEFEDKSKHRKYFIFTVPCIVIFYGMTNRCDNVQ